MRYRTRKVVAAKDLNANGSLFGGQMLAWIDEEAYIVASSQIDSPSVVTRSMSEVNFLASARLGDIVEIGAAAVALGRTSITVECDVRNLRTQESITRVDRIVFVHVDAEGTPRPHGKQTLTEED